MLHRAYLQENDVAKLHKTIQTKTMPKGRYSIRFLLLHVFLVQAAVSFVVPNPSRFRFFPVAFASDVDEEEAALSPPPVSDEPVNLFLETVPMLWASRLVYTFASLVRETRAGKLKVPQATLHLLNNTDRSALFPESFRDINGLIKENWDVLTELAKDEKDGSFRDFDYQLLEQLKKVEKQTPNDDTIWLEGFDSLYQEKECVYGIVRDDNLKHIIVTFRGSVADGTMDWARNFQVRMNDMKVPKKLLEIMKERNGDDVKETIPVHRGFYAYLFNNDEKISGKQKFDKIRDKLKILFTNPAYKDYKLYIAGHSLGAALSSMVAFKLAGSKKEWLPKPVTCISFESPMNGGVEFRDAFQILEQEKLIRYLRVVNKEDIVPAIPPWSLRLDVWNQRLYKHVGIELNLRNNDYLYRYPRDDNGVSRAISNNFVTKKFWNVDKYHGLALVQERLDEHVGDFSSAYIDDLYKDESIVGESFVEGSKDEL